MIKVKLKKVFEAGFIRPVENIEWVSPITLAFKKKKNL